MKPPEYQKDLSLQSPILLDQKYKQAKVEKLIAILLDARLISDESKRLALDIGCSRGFFTNALAPYFMDVVGADIDTHALRIAKTERKQNHVHFIVGDSMCLPFEENSVDLVVCNHVYEHVPNAEQLFSEIYRVLKDKGVCYFGAASRFTVIEPHYHLPLLSWLPKPLAHRYMRATHKGDYYYENLRTYGGIKKLISNFEILDYTLRVISHPDRFNARDLIPRGGLLEKVPLYFWKAFYRLLPSYILLLRKHARHT